MKSFCHRLEYFEAPEKLVHTAAKSWWQDNGFIVQSPECSSVIASYRGRGFGITDKATKRIMQVILQPIGNGTAVSVYHHASRILFITGVMFGNILDRETDSFLQSIHEYVAANK